jgi:hypothetical protein
VFNGFDSMFDQKELQKLFKLIQLSLINIFQSEKSIILDDQELFRKVFQPFSKQEPILQAGLDYLISQMPRDKTQVLNEILFILSSDVEKEATINYLSSLRFFDELFKIKESQNQRLILDVLSSSLPFYQIQTRLLIQVLKQQIEEYYFKDLIDQ